MPSIIIFIILGIVQGFTEPLPISSSGHLVIFQALLNVDPNALGISYSAFINFGSTIAICIYFFDTLWDLLKGFINFIITKGQENKAQMDYCLKIIVATLPLVFAGIIFLLFDIEFVENVKVVGYALFFTSMTLFFVSSKNSGDKLNESMTYKDALIIGLFQAIALVPGISRSGMTITAALLIGYKNKDAFDFSFIMFVPASLGALIFSLLDIATDPNVTSFLGEYVLSLILAFVFTLVGLVITKKIVLAAKLKYFAIYCLIVSTTIILFV